MFTYLFIKYFKCKVNKYFREMITFKIIFKILTFEKANNIGFSSHLIVPLTSGRR